MDTTAPLRARPALLLGRYAPLRRLGAGAFGTVWLARDERLGREVAVKVVPAERVGAGRGWREALAAARLGHPAIVALYEAARDGEAAYLVSECVRGAPLSELLEEGALSDRDVAEVGVALAGALAHAHERGVVHRDVKPGNVLVPEEQRPGAPPAKLTDFGVARVTGDDPLTLTGDVVGTLAYMAPEQAEGRRVGPEADLYALALVLYEGWAGTNPVRAATPAATARRVGAPVPPLAGRRPDLPAALARAVDRALALAPEDRGAVADLGHALDRALPELEDEPGWTRPVPPPMVPEPETDLDLGAPPVARRPSPALARLFAAGAAGVLVALALAAEGDEARATLVLSPAALDGTGFVVALAVAALVLLLPRIGWSAAATIAVAALAGPGGAPGAALLVAAALAGPPLLLPRSGALWSLPAVGPGLVVLGLAGAAPALAGLAAGPWRRAALGALAAWWSLLAAPLTGEPFLGADPAPVGWAVRPGEAGEILGAAASGPALGLVALWAVAAAVLPAVVRRRPLLGAAAWTAALAASWHALGPGSTALVAAAAAPAALLAGSVAWPRATRRGT